MCCLGFPLWKTVETNGRFLQACPYEKKSVLDQKKKKKPKKIRSQVVSRSFAGGQSKGGTFKESHFRDQEENQQDTNRKKLKRST